MSSHHLVRRLVRCLSLGSAAKSVGCFSEGSHSDAFDGPSAYFTFNGPTKCAANCFKEGYMYAGLSRSTCKCGSSVSTFVACSLLSQFCYYDNERMLSVVGGSYRNSSFYSFVSNIMLSLSLLLTGKLLLACINWMCSHLQRKFKLSRIEFEKICIHLLV